MTAVYPLLSFLSLKLGLDEGEFSKHLANLGPPLHSIVWYKLTSFFQDEKLLGAEEDLHHHLLEILSCIHGANDERVVVASAFVLFLPSSVFVVAVNEAAAAHTIIVAFPVVAAVDVIADLELEEEQWELFVVEMRATFDSQMLGTVNVSAVAGHLCFLVGGDVV